MTTKDNMILGAYPLDIGLAVVGGIIISISTIIHMYFKGRVTGISGIFFGVITYEKK